MNAALDYIVRPANPDETSLRLQVRLNSRQFTAAIRLCETFGPVAIWGGSLDARLIRRDTQTAARALREGLTAQRDKLTAQDWDVLSSLVKFLEGPGKADGVVITRALPSAEDEKAPVSAADIKNEQFSRFFVQHGKPKPDNRGAEPAACRRESCAPSGRS